MLLLKQTSLVFAVSILLTVRLLQYEVFAEIHNLNIPLNEKFLSKQYQTDQNIYTNSILGRHLGVYDSSLPAANKDGCTLCNNIINDFRKDILAQEFIMPAGSMTNAHFRKQHWCSSKVTLQEQNMCNEILKRGDEIALMIDNGLSNDDICARVNGSCKPPTIKDGCTICKAAAQYIGECIKYGNMSIEIIEVGAKIMCIAMEGQAVSKECDFIIDHIDDIIQWLENGFSADEICERLRICPKGDHLTEASDSEKLCSMCNIVTDVIQASVELNQVSLDTVQQGLEKACSAMQNARADCEKIIQRFEEIILYSQQNFQRAEICRKLDVCTKVHSEYPRCIMCKNAVEMIEARMKNDNRIIPLLRESIQRMCSTLDLPQCNEVMKTVDDVARWMVKGVDPEKICADVSACQDKLGVSNGGNQVSPLCKTCELVIKAVERVAKEDNSTIKKLRRSIEKVCHLVPVPECSEFLKRFDIVSQWLVDGKNPQEVCHKISMCPTSNQAFKEVSSCLICEIAVGATEEYIKVDNSTLPRLRESIKQLCDELPIPQCADFLVKFDEVAGWLEKGVSPKKVCEDIAICTNASALTLPATQGDSNCLLCEVTVEALELRIKQDNTTIENIRKSIDEACQVFPIPECSDFLKKFDEIAELLEHDASPKKVCQDLSLCSSAEKHKGGTSTCFMCEIAAGAAEEYIKIDNTSLPQLRNSIAQLCNELPLPECDDFLKNFDEITGWLEKGVSPKMICKDVGLCSNPMAFKSKFSNSTVNCLFCEAGVEALELRLKEDNSTIDQIRKSIKEACDVFPVQECSNLMKRVDEISELLKGRATSREVCQHMAICSKEENISNKIPKCLLCEIAVGAAEEYVKVDNSTLPRLRESIKQLCAEVPLPECGSFLKKFDEVAGWINGGVSPQKVCEDVAVCTNASTIARTSFREDPNCLLCEITIEALELRLKEDNSTIEKIRQSIQQACEIFPIPQCSDFLKKFDEISGWLEHGASPKKICKSISLCAVDEFKKGDVPNCLLCKLAVGSSEEYLKGDNSTIPQLRKLLEQLCSDLPLVERNAVLAKFDEFSGWLRTGVSPEVLCENLTFCNRYSEFSSEVPKCLICEVIIEAMEETLKHDNTTIPRMRQALEEACTALPLPQCADFLKEFDEVTELLVKGESPKKVCERISVCPASTKSKANIKSDVCLMCVHATIAIEHSVKQDNSTLEMLKKAIEATCHAMPQLPECDIIVKRFEEIASWLEDGKEPRAICSSIGLCAESFNQSLIEPSTTSIVSILNSNAAIE